MTGLHCRSEFLFAGSWNKSTFIQIDRAISLSYWFNFFFLHSEPIGKKRSGKAVTCTFLLNIYLSSNSFDLLQNYLNLPTSIGHYRAWLISMLFEPSLRKTKWTLPKLLLEFTFYLLIIPILFHFQHGSQCKAEMHTPKIKGVKGWGWRKVSSFICPFLYLWWSVWDCWLLF